MNLHLPHVLVKVSSFPAVHPDVPETEPNVRYNYPVEIILSTCTHNWYQQRPFATSQPCTTPVVVSSRSTYKVQMRNTSIVGTCPGGQESGRTSCNTTDVIVKCKIQLSSRNLVFDLSTMLVLATIFRNIPTMNS